MQQLAPSVLYRRMRLRWPTLLLASLLAGCPDGTTQPPAPPPETFAPRIAVDVTGGLRTTEAGDRARFSLWLTAKPKHAVSIGLHSTNDAEGAVTPSRITFTPDSWQQRQPIDVKGVDDDVKDGDQRYAVVLEPALSEDTDYLGMVGPQIDVVNSDDESPAIVGVGTPPASITEGKSVPLSLRLTARPSAPVRVRAAVKGTNVLLDPSEFVFYPTSWDKPRELTVRAVDADVSVTPAETVFVAFAPAESDDPLFSGLVAPSVMFERVDNDKAALKVPTRVTYEEGGSADLTVTLATQPLSDVTVTVTPKAGPPYIGVTPQTLTATSATWQTPLVFRLATSRDNRDNADATSEVTVSTTSMDAAYANLKATVPVTITDVDPAPALLLTAATTTTRESGDTTIRCVTMNIALSTDTTDWYGIGVTLSSSDPGEGIPSETSVYVTRAGKSVQICGVDDTDADGDQPFTITARVTSSSDAAYPTTMQAQKTFTNQDDGERAGDTCGQAIALTVGAAPASYSMDTMYNDFRSCAASAGNDMVFAIPVGANEKIRVDVVGPAVSYTYYPRAHLFLTESCTNLGCWNDMTANDQGKAFATYTNGATAKTIYAIVDGTSGTFYPGAFTIAATLVQ